MATPPRKCDDSATPPDADGERTDDGAETPPGSGQSSGRKPGPYDNLPIIYADADPWNANWLRIMAAPRVAEEEGWDEAKLIQVIANLSTWDEAKVRAWLANWRRREAEREKAKEKGPDGFTPPPPAKDVQH